MTKFEKAYPDFRALARAARRAKTHKTTILDHPRFQRIKPVKKVPVSRPLIPISLPSNISIELVSRTFRPEVKVGDETPDGTVVRIFGSRMTVAKVVKRNFVYDHDMARIDRLRMAGAVPPETGISEGELDIIFQTMSIPSIARQSYSVTWQHDFQNYRKEFPTKLAAQQFANTLSKGFPQ